MEKQVRQVAVFCDRYSGDILAVFVASTLEETKELIFNEYSVDGECDLYFCEVYNEESSEEILYC